MALKDYASADTLARSKRGTTTRSLGGSAPTPTTYVSKPSSLPGVVQKGLDVGKQVGSIGGTIAKKAGSFVANTPKYIYEDVKPFLQGVATTVTGNLSQDLKRTRIQTEALDQQVQMAFKQYKNGQMTKENYSRILREVGEGYKEVQKENDAVLASTDRGDVVESAALTIATIVSAGKLKNKNSAVRAYTNAASKGTRLSRASLLRVADDAAGAFEKTAMKIPAVKDVVVRNLERDGKRAVQRLAGESVDQFLKREGRQVAVDLLIKRPIFYQANIGQTESLYNNLLEGDYKGAITDAAWLGSQMVSGGPIGILSKGNSFLKNTTKKLAYGRESLIDNLSKQIGDNNPQQIARYLTNLKESSPEQFREAEEVFRVLQESNLQMAGDDVNRAVTNILTHYDQHGFNRANLTPEMIFKDYQNWYKADQLAQNAIKSGALRNVPPEDAAKYVVVRWDQTARQGLIDAYAKEGAEGVAKLMQRPAVSWVNNSILVNRVEAAVNQAKSVEEFQQAIKAITAVDSKLSGLPKSVANQLQKLGYSIAAPLDGRITPVIDDVNDTRKLVSAAVDNNTEIFDAAIAPQPSVQAIAGFLTKAGLSPEATNEVAQRALAESVISNLDTSVARGLGVGANVNGDLVNGGRAILTRLKQYVEDKPAFLGLGKRAAITDIRQLTNREIADALKITTQEAKDVSKAIMKGYQDVPLELRGLGDKIVDVAFRVNPMQKYYSRIQAAMRYTYNPFFRLQERAETAIFSRTQANNLIWNKSREELNAAAKILDDAGIFTSSLPGEAAQDVVLGRITANITQAQKRDLAGLASDMAQARGVDLQTMVTQHADEIDDALRVVVQYPKQGVLASPLARTINLAFFPMRYNAKVTMLAAQALGKQPPSVQKAVLHSMFQMREWLKSDEGIRWQRDHADAIQILKWITPANSIESTFKLLTGGVDSLGEMGQLGGLPFGIISQILDGQGIITLNKPYVNPKTGDVLPRYIPQSTKARAAVAVGDLLNTMFTYPGRIMGLPGKEQKIRELIDVFIDTNGADFEKRLDEESLSPLQKNWVRVLKGDTSEEAIDALYNSPAPGEFNWYTLPPMDLPIRTTAPDAPQLTPRRGLQTKKQKAAAAKAAKTKNVAQPIR